MLKDKEFFHRYELIDFVNQNYKVQPISIIYNSHSYKYILFYSE